MTSSPNHGKFYEYLKDMLQVPEISSIIVKLDENGEVCAYAVMEEKVKKTIDS